MNDRFLKACRSETVDRIPVWFMRQAGRSLPGYRALREKYDVLTLAQTPELAAQVALEPVARLGVDAAILFADIMLLPLAMGIDLKIVDAVGPIIAAPLKDARDVAALRPFDPSSVAYLGQTIGILRGEFGDGAAAVPLIGFSGAPFTLASYLIEGQPSRTWTKTKRFMFEQPEAWERLMALLSDAIIGYLSIQIDAGAQAVQLFDSWVGCLSPDEYRRSVLPHVQRIFSALRSTAAGRNDVPRIHFATNTGAMLRDFANVDCEVIGVDWRIDIGEAKHAISIARDGGATGREKAVQGNLDPAILLADERTIAAASSEVIGALAPNAKRGFIFNLGHGVLPETDDGKLKYLVDYVHAK